MSKTRILMLFLVNITIGIFIFFSLKNNTNPIFLGAISAIVLAGLNGAISGSLLGGASSLLAGALGLYYRLNKIKAPIMKQVDELDEEALKKAIASFNRASKTWQDNMEFYSNYKFIILIAMVLAVVLSRYVFKKLKPEDFQEEVLKKRSIFGPRYITYMGVFIALSVAINSLRVGNISFGGFPIIYSGLALGPISGFIVGGISDILGFLIRPSSNAFNPIFVLTSALTGAIPAFVMMFVPKRIKTNPKIKFFFILLAIAIGQCITSVLIVPYATYKLYGGLYLQRLLKALIKQLYSVPLYAFLYMNTSETIKSQINFNKVKEA